MASHHTRMPTRIRNNNSSTHNENTNIKPARRPSNILGFSRPIVKAKQTADRQALGEVVKFPNNRMGPTKMDGKGKDVENIKEEVPGSLKRTRSASLAAATGPQRVPLGPGRVAPPVANKFSASRIQAPPSRQPPIFASHQPVTTTVEVVVPVVSRTVVHEERHEIIEQPVQQSAHDINMEFEVEDVENAQSKFEIVDTLLSAEAQQAAEDILSSDVEGVDETDEDDDEFANDFVWPDMPTQRRLRCRMEVENIRETFVDVVEAGDTTMVSEYAEDIFDYMEELEEDMMPNPDYMLKQRDLSWSMRQTLVDWLLQVHIRYHLLPETLWIAINIVDRFLSKRIVSHLKLQLVGVTALFIAAKYEEILAPGLEEFVFMTGNGYSKAEILKGERILLQTIDFKVSHYCSPYSWMRKISKADDYDLQTRTLSKFLTEVTLLDYRFLRAKPSLVAAVGMYTARKMLGGNWDDAFIYYSGVTEKELVQGHQMLVEKLTEEGFSKLYVCKKYAQKKFLKASIFAVEWAAMHINGEFDLASDDAGGPADMFVNE